MYPPVSQTRTSSLSGLERSADIGITSRPNHRVSQRSTDESVSRRTLIDEGLTLVNDTQTPIDDPLIPIDDPLTSMNGPPDSH